MCPSLLNQSVVNHAIDEWRRRLSTLKADILNIRPTYDCYSQNNNVEMAALNLISGDDFFCSLLL